MRTKDNSKKKLIIDFIDGYFDNYKAAPSLRQISVNTGIALSTVHRYLQSMNDAGLLSYKGRKNIHTKRMGKELGSFSMPVLGYVSCGEGEEENEEIIEYIRLPESILGKGDFFALISKGESMIDVGIYPGDYVIVNKSLEPNIGDIVVAFYEGKSSLKVLRKTKDNKGYFLESCNSDKEKYPDIYVNDLIVQGVAVTVICKVSEMLRYNEQRKEI